MGSGAASLGSLAPFAVAPGRVRVAPPGSTAVGARDSRLSLARVLGAEVWSVPAMLQARAERSPSRPALWQRGADGAWTSMSWQETRDEVARVARGLRRLGLRAGERVGIIAPSSREWDLVHLGVLAARGVVVGLDASWPDEHLRETAARCELAGVVAGSPELLDRLGGEARRRLRFELCLGGAAGAGLTLGGLRELAGPGAPGWWDLSRPDEPATIVFTSGTTGAPRGVVYSHRQVCLATASMLTAFSELGEGTRTACWLPLANLFQRMVNLCAVACGAETFYVEDPREVMQHLPTIAPHVFFAVPRFFEKLHAGILETIRGKPRWSRALAGWALGEGHRFQALRRAGGTPGLVARVRHAVAERLVLRRLRAPLGPSIRYLVSGSAPTPPWLLERFEAMGLMLLEAYGMSENIIPNAANRPDCYRLGTVGKAMPGSEVRLAPDGELLVRGPGTCSGYFGEPATAGLRDAAGFVPSGDFATIDADGFITLVGRKSEVFKTSTGRQVAPAMIESHLRRLPYVEHAAVVGAGLAFPLAVLVVSEAALTTHLGPGELSAVAGGLAADVEKALAEVPRHQRPGGAIVTARPLTVAGGELTPNLKLRRAAVEAHYRALLAELRAALEAKRGLPRAVEDVGAPAALISLEARHG